MLVEGLQQHYEVISGHSAPVSSLGPPSSLHLIQGFDPQPDPISETLETRASSASHRRGTSLHRRGHPSWFMKPKSALEHQSSRLKVRIRTHERELLSLRAKSHDSSQNAMSIASCSIARPKFVHKPIILCRLEVLCQLSTPFKGHTP